MATPRHPGSDVFGVTLFSLMVAAVATAALIVVGGFDLLTAAFLGPGVGVLVAIVLAILLRRREPPIAREPVRRDGDGTRGDAPPRGSRSDPASATRASGSDAPREAPGPAR